ncbi:replicative DNA helicase [Spirosoma panaciterrae]|uniref:replicative DNA helicase n=1 Tax=Spirosoma panaciterrae TaxID=496058 RepID=UPI0003654C5F|nr:DnaB-like helicase C-terminal domain-containing protein [Spirosoma panaciterrae]
MKNACKPKKANEATNSFDDTGLPVDVSAERALVAMLMDLPKLLSEARELLGSGEIITHDGYRLLWDTLYAMEAASKPIRLGTVLQFMNANGTAAKLLEMGISLIDLPYEAKAFEFADTCVYLRNLWIKRLAIESAGKILSSVRSGESVSSLTDLMTQAAESVSAGLSFGVDPTLTDSVSESLKCMESAMTKPGALTGVTTGLGKLNRNLGGWQDSDVIMIAGRPGMGKSVAGLYHTISAAREGVPVAFLSLEMPTKSMINRLISSETQIEYGRMKKGNLTKDEFTQIHKAAGLIERLPIHFYDDYNRDINDLSYKLLNWKKRYGIGLVVIDYVQLMTDRTVKSSSEYDVLTSVSKKLKQLQRRLSCPVIELAQLNRAVEGRIGSKRAGMADLRNTGQFEQDASVVIILYRDDYYKEKAARDAAEASGRGYVEPIFDHLIEYAIVKNRDGETGTAVFWADVATNRIADQAPSVQVLTISNPPATSSVQPAWELNQVPPGEEGF